MAWRNSRQQGNAAENAFMEMAEALGYATFAARGSRGPVDVLCFERDGNGGWHSLEAMMLVPLVVQVGTTKKPIAATLAELQAAPRPIGSRCIVARRHRMKNRRIRWTFHHEGGKYDTLAEAIA